MKMGSPQLIFDFTSDVTDLSSRQRLVFNSPLKLVVATNLDQVRHALKEVWKATREGFYAAGFISYEAAPAFDKAITVQTQGDLPLLWFGIFEKPVELTIEQKPFFSGDWKPSISREAYDQNISTIRTAIERGDTYQVNYTIRLLTTFNGDPLSWYNCLYNESHGAFNAYLDIGPHQIISMSPELFFSWDENTLVTRPMKGTAKRAEHSLNADEDRALANNLVSSEKNRAENLMIVDLLRNDLSRIAVTGSVKVPHLFSLEKYPTLYQLTSTITAETNADLDLDDIFEALFPCGSITGAPKIKTTEIITALEDSPRGVYCGAIGFVTPEGKATFNVPIRTVVIDQQNGKAECGVGGGIVWDSVAADEYNEMLTKARFLKSCRQHFELLETLLLKDGQYALLNRHIERLRASATHLYFVFDEEKILQKLNQYSVEFKNSIRRVRLLLDKDGKVHLESTELKDAPTNLLYPQLSNNVLNVALAQKPVDRHYPLLYHKTTERSFYDRYVIAEANIFDTLLWNQENELTEFTRGSLVLEIDNQLLTPPIESGLLPGTLRAELVQKNIIKEKTLLIDDLKHASRMWFVNSVRGWVQVKLK